MTSNAHKGRVLPPTYGKLLIQYLQLPPMTAVSTPQYTPPAYALVGEDLLLPALANAARVEIYHLSTGRRVGMYKSNNGTTLRIHTAQWIPGMYALRYTNAQGQIVHQLRYMKY